VVAPSRPRSETFSQRGGFEDIKGKPIAMTFRRKEAKFAMEGSLRDQMNNISNEAGVRKQLECLR
jgi:hypothetical protein